MRLKLIRFICLLTWVAVCPFAASAETKAAPPSDLAVVGVRLGQNGATTRMVLDLNKKPEYNIFTLQNPYRAVVTLPSLRWQLLPGMGMSERGVIKNFRYGSFAENSFRVVLDLKSAAKIVNVDVIPPGGKDKAVSYRLVMDLTPVDAAAFKPQKFGSYNFEAAKTEPAVAAVAQPPVADAKKPEMAQTPSQPQQKAKPQKIEEADSAPSQDAASEADPEIESRPSVAKNDAMKTIVIDAGHGGVDPGAIGAHRVYEKNITLAAAMELRDILQKNSRYRVVLTRENDKFLKLRDRSQKARAANADLFISLHADHHPKREVSGASVYTLSEKGSDAEAERLAEQENKSDLIAGYDLSDQNDAVSNILLNLAQQETMSHSVFFGGLLVKELKQSAAVIENPLRAAAFAVLKSPDVPSVLIEMGYLSNPQDESNLSKAEYRHNLVAEIADAIDNYFQKIQIAPHSAL